jgi:hypothetical protein
MIAKLSPELARELEHAGNQPLQVEDPATKRVYVLVDLEQFEVVPRTPTASLAAWTESKNKRRCHLIRKKFSHGISAAEGHELIELQEELSAYRKQVAPLPYDVVDALQAALTSPPGFPVQPTS